MAVAWQDARHELRLVKHEPDPDYDGTPIDQGSRFVTVNRVDVTRTILGTLGVGPHAVYAILDTYCNADDQAWPSLETIAENICASVSSVRRWIAALEAAGWITRTPRYNTYGILTGMIYGLPHRTIKAEAMPVHSRVNDVSQPRHSEQVGNTKVSPKVKSPPPPPQNEQPTETGYTPEFERFMAAYPKRKAKADAWRAWRKLRPSPELQARMLAAVAVQRVSPDWCRNGGQYIPLPATWLNGERWQDDVAVSVPDGPTGPPGVALLDGERVEQLGPASWNLHGTDGRVRKVRPEYVGVVWDERQHINDGASAFYEAVRVAKGRQEGAR